MHGLPLRRFPFGRRLPHIPGGDRAIGLPSRPVPRGETRQIVQQCLQLGVQPRFSHRHVWKEEIGRQIAAIHSPGLLRA